MLLAKQIVVKELITGGRKEIPEDDGTKLSILIFVLLVGWLVGWLVLFFLSFFLFFPFFFSLCVCGGVGGFLFLFLFFC